MIGYDVTFILYSVAVGGLLVWLGIAIERNRGVKKK